MCFKTLGDRLIYIWKILCGIYGIYQQPLLNDLPHGLTEQCSGALVSNSNVLRKISGPTTPTANVPQLLRGGVKSLHGKSVSLTAAGIFKALSRDIISS